jgi:hypothetical protein
MHTGFIELVDVLLEDGFFEGGVYQVDWWGCAGGEYDIDLDVFADMYCVLDKITKFASRWRFIKSKTSKPEAYERDWKIGFRKLILYKMQKSIPIMSMHNFSNSDSDISIIGNGIDIMNGQIG